MSGLAKLKIHKTVNLKNKAGSLPRYGRFFWSFFIILALLASQVLFIEPVKAAISLRGSATTGSSTGNTSITINKPAGVVIDDVMIATISTTGSPALTAPAGWTAIEAAPTISGGIQLQTYYKRAGSDEGSSYQWSWTGTQRAAGGIVAFQGVDRNLANPIDNAGAAHSKAVTSGNAIAAPGITTASNNAMLIASYANESTGPISQPPGMTERFDLGGDGGVLATDVRTSGNTEIWPTAGGTGARTASGDVGNYAAHMVALTPAPAATVDQSAYRFSINADNNTPARLTSNLTAANDTINGTAVDTNNSVFYTVGDNAASWVVEKRRIADGSLCTSTNCGATFGTAGRIVQDVAGSTTEKAYGVTVDPSNDAIYVVGNDQAVAAGQWRIEKRSASTGALITGFGTNGVIQRDLSPGDDTALVALLDRVNGYLYVGGYDSGLSNGNNRWSLHKYRTDNGSICSAANCGTTFGTAGIYTYSFASNSNDRVAALEIDPTRTYLYVAGYSTSTNGKTQWTMQKMRANDAALCSAANCGTQFGTNGIYTNDPTNRDDKIKTLQVDSAGGAIYLGGYEQNTATSSQWRIEKLNLDTGILINGFGGSGCATNQNGALCTNFSTGYGSLESLSLDGAGGYIYSLGVMDEQGPDSQWRIQKRNRSDGSLVSDWASNGTASVNPSANLDPPNSIVIDVDRGLLWATGGDRSISTTDMQWYFTQLQLDTGTLWLAPQDTVAAASTNITFRLRLLLHTSSQNLLASDARQFKLKYSPRVGTCDTSFVGESYVDVATGGSSEILYHDNPNNAEAAAATALPGDPVHGTDTSVLQTIEEANNFTNTSDVLNGRDGLWDFVLKDNNAFGAYCFKVVNSDGTDLASYTTMPEVTFCKEDPKTEALLRHGTYFCEGLKKSFIWTL